MLLEFKTKNYKSFKDELVFSMIPAPKQKGLDYSILTKNIATKTYKGLSSAVIYGPNASGKTNIIGAMDTFKNIILRGNIRNGDNKTLPNKAGNNLELIPCCFSNNNNPVEFAIKFIENDIVFDYTLIIDLGGFLKEEYKRKIISESLTVNEKLVFSRNTTLHFDDMKVIKSFLINDFDTHIKSAETLAKSNLNDEELFLMNGFKVMFSSKLVSVITEWLEKKFMIIYKADSLHITKNIVDHKKKTIYIEKTINEAAKIFGINSNSLGYIIPEDGSDAELYSFFDKINNSTVISADDFESYGTIRFVNIFTLVVDAIKNGATLVADEFDASIHPMAIMSITNLFHNDDINKKNAQLIFNTHNPIFLNSNLYRRDEIKFVERDDVTHESIHYSLSDFGTSGETGVRKSEDYMKNYFVNRYGAIKDVDFTPIFEDTEGNEKEV